MAEIHLQTEETKEPTFKHAKKTGMILLLAGVTTILPWNFYMSAYDYFMFRLTLHTKGEDANLFVEMCGTMKYSDMESKVLNEELCVNSNSTSTCTWHGKDLIKDYDAKDFYSLAFPEIVPEVESEETEESTTVKQVYTAFWNSALSFVTMGTMVAVSLMSNSQWFIKKFSVDFRVLKMLSIEVFLLVLTILQIYWEVSVKTFFLSTLAAVIFVNIVSGIFQTTMFQVGSQLPKDIYNKFLQGQAYGGIIANLVAVLGGFITEHMYDSKTEQKALNNTLALGFFGVAAIIVATTYFGYKTLQKCDAYQYYYLNKVNKTENTEETKKLTEENMEEETVSSTAFIFKTGKFYLISVWVVFGVTLALFPTMTAEAKSTTFFNKKDGCGYDSFNPYWFKLGVLLMFNIGDLIGRNFANKFTCGINEKNSETRILSYALGRLIFCFLFYYSNITGTERSIISGDFKFLIIMLAFSISNGYIGAMAMQYAPSKFTKNADKGAIGGYIVVVLTLGLMSGSVFSFVSASFIQGAKSVAMELTKNEKLAGALAACVTKCGL